MAEERVQRRLAAILAADVVGYSRLIEQDEAGTRARLRTLHAELIAPRISQDGGRIVKTMGDGMLVEFSSAVAAVENALWIQKSVAEHETDQPEDRRICFRVGINVGDVIIEDDDIHGDGVNVAARLEGLCQPGEVYVSGTVYDQAAGKLEASFEALGEQTVKNIAKPVRTYHVQAAQAKIDGQQKPTIPVSPPLPDKPSIAVLPFTNMSGDPEQEYFADGISEDIITGLSRFHWFFVIARNSSFTFKGQAVDIAEVSKQLGVKYVLEGSVRKAGNRVRITAQLIDAISGGHIWADRYDRDLNDVFAVQDQITEAIIRAVAPSFVSAEARRVERKLPESYDAWDNAMLGNWYVWRFGKEDLAEATRLFETAISLDPKCTLALSGLSLANQWRFIWGWAEDAEQAREEALRMAMRAVATDENDALAHAVLCRIRSIIRDFEGAISSGVRALELNPNLAFAEGALAHAYACLGDYDNTALHADRAERLSPRDPTCILWFMSRSWVAILTKRYEDSVVWARKMIDSNPEFSPGWCHLAADYALLGRPEEAHKAIQQARRLTPDLLDEASRWMRIPYAPQMREGMEEYVAGISQANQLD